MALRPDRKCLIEGCEVVILHWQRRRRYCEAHEREIYRQTIAAMARTPGGQFLPKASQQGAMIAR